MASIPIPTSLFLNRSQPLCSRFFGMKHPWIIGRKRSRARIRAEVRVGCNGLEVLYEDGHGIAGMADYIDAAIDLVTHDAGPPRWFCPVDCGAPVKNAPLLLFLPDVDGIGVGLLLHHKALGRLFEVRCMHIPSHDRTPFEGLVKFVEDVVIAECSIYKNKPIYLIGHSFGGCLALSVAARNRNIDVVLILSNPATSFAKSKLQSLLPILTSVSYRLSVIVPCLLSYNIGNQVKMAMDDIKNGHHLLHTLISLSRNLSSPLQLLDLHDMMPKETFLWKLDQLKSAASYANSRLHAVKAEVLILASCQDNILHSREEAERLLSSLSNCKVHFFKDRGHSLLLEGGINLLSIIKGTGLYRNSPEHNHVSDFVPPTMMDLKAMDKYSRLLHLSTSPVMFSTLEDGKIMRGLSGIPNEGPVLVVGNHMLLGLELIPLVTEFLREKRVVLRGMGHPVLFPKTTESSLQGPDAYIFAKLFGGVPVSFSNFYRLLSMKSFVLLYPGGIREALHRKGEEYKLFWPYQPEFVRMATRFGATIIPFGAVGEDDMGELMLDYDDLMRIPFIKDSIRRQNQHISHAGITGEVRKQDIVLPIVVPKLPGRIYCLFGKPIMTKGNMNVLKDRDVANDLYLQVKAEVESCIAYLKAKREEDKYRSLLQRSFYQAVTGSHIIPTFDP